MEKNLESEYSLLRTLVSQISRGIIVVNERGIITFYNNHAEEVLDVEACLAKGKEFWDYFTDDLFGFSLKEALETKSFLKTAFVTLFSHDGEKKELEIQTGLISGSDLFILFRDVTEARKTEELANRHERMQELGRLASLIAHEIRNPLGGIKGFATLLKRDFAETPEAKKMAQAIIDGTESLEQLASNILHYSRPVVPQKKSTDLVSFIQHLKSHTLAEQIENLTFEVQTTETSLSAPIDQTLLKSALFNLIQNAKQAMPKGGKLTISLEKHPKDVLIKVKDTGMGIPLEQQDQIFSPFFTTKSSGNGFGLTEVRQIIHAHHGNISVRSTPGQGTTFTIKIPHEVL